MMHVRLTLTVPETTAPTPRWPDGILARHPEPDGVPDMRLAGCTRIRSEVHGKNTAVLTFEWSGQPLSGGLDHDAFVDWWGRESGWDYKVETSASWANTASGPTGAVTYEPDINGRPCRTT